MANTEINDTRWTERSKNNAAIGKVKEYIISKMKDRFEYYEKGGEIYFKTNDDTVMHVCILKRDTESSLVMSYNSPNDSEDGDQFYVSDYSSLDEMFEEMYREANY